MRTLIPILAVAFALGFFVTACGYRTPLALPNPDSKPAAGAPAGSTAK